MIDCLRCGGSGEHVECFDDLCHANGRCYHGQNTCKLCGGLGRISRELASRWQNRDPFETIDVPDEDLIERGHIDIVRERRGDA